MPVVCPTCAKPLDGEYVWDNQLLVHSHCLGKGTPKGSGRKDSEDYLEIVKSNPDKYFNQYYGRGFVLTKPSALVFYAEGFCFEEALEYCEDMVRKGIWDKYSWNGEKLYNISIPFPVQPKLPERGQ